MAKEQERSGRIDPRLYVMMFLHYAVWGIWMPILPAYLKDGLGFSEYQMAFIAGVAGSIGALLSPFVAGQIADRYFSTERYLAVTMFAGGVINWVLAYQTSFGAWVALSTIYAVLYMPTLALTNSLAMAHLSNPRRQFSLVRVWGTIAWITVAWVFPMLWLQDQLHWRWLPPFLVGTDLPDATMRIADGLKISGALSLAYGVFCWFLPHTPPKRDAVEKLAFGKAFGLLARRRSLAVLVIASLMLAAIHKVYFLQTAKFLISIGVAKANVMAAMSIGQFSEIAIMVFLGLMLTRLGFRWVLTIGALAYLVRYVIFANTWLPLELIVASQALHGLCFACAWVAAFIYINRMAPADVRASMQSVFNMTTMGVGFILGSVLGGFLGDFFETEAGINFSGVWYSSAAVALAATLLLALGFRDESVDAPAEEAEPEAQGRPTAEPVAQVEVEGRRA